MLLVGCNRSERPLEIYDLRKSNVVETLVFEQDANALIYAASFCKKTGQAIIAGGAGDNKVRIFSGPDKRNFDVIGYVGEMDKAVFSLDFSNKADMFVIGNADGFLRVYNMSRI